MATTINQIDDFLALKRIAVVGVSRNPKEISDTLWQELRQRRYDAVPVNPATTEIDGKPCYASVRDIDPPVEGALIMTTAAVADQVIEDCADGRHPPRLAVRRPGRRCHERRRRSLRPSATGSTRSPATARTCSCPARRSSTGSTASARS